MNDTVNRLLDELAIVLLALIEGRITEAAYEAEVVRLLDAIEAARD
jgi:hypothetical protein